MAEPIKEGLNAHLKRVDDLIKNLNTEIQGLQRIEKALSDAHARLDRQGGLIVMETHLIESLIKHDKPDKLVAPAVSLRAISAAAIGDRVEADLAQLITDNKPKEVAK
jgi:hypothetical protein